MTVGFHGALCKQSVNLEQSKADDMGRQCMRAARVSLFFSKKPRRFRVRIEALRERLLLLSRRCAVS
jgi:hypothetical protein